MPVSNGCPVKYLKMVYLSFKHTSISNYFRITQAFFM